jgi:hypothetical protein
VVVGGRIAKVANITELTRDPKSGAARSLEDALRPIYEGNQP